MGMQRYGGVRSPYDDFGEDDLSLSPDALAQYEAVKPGAAERILRLAEDRANYSYQIEQARITSEARKAYVSLGVGGGLSAFGVFVGTGIAIAESPGVGMIVIALSFFLFAAIFFTVIGQRPSTPALPARRTEPPRQISAFDL
jgi:uncharacterized membrane protein